MAKYGVTFRPAVPFIAPRYLQQKTRPESLAKISRSTEAFTQITGTTHVLGIQTGEFNPIAQCISSLDVALWDLEAKRHRMPLHKLLSDSSGLVNIYADSISIWRSKFYK